MMGRRVLSFRGGVTDALLHGAASGAAPGLSTSGGGRAEDCGHWAGVLRWGSGFELVPLKSVCACACVGALVCSHSVGSLKPIGGLGLGAWGLGFGDWGLRLGRGSGPAPGPGRCDCSLVA